MNHVDYATLLKEKDAEIANLKRDLHCARTGIPNTERDMLIFDAWLAGEKTKEIAEKFGVSYGRTSQIINKLTKLTKRGIHTVRWATPTPDNILNAMYERWVETSISDAWHFCIETKVFPRDGKGEGKRIDLEWLR